MTTEISSAHAALHTPGTPRTVDLAASRQYCRQITRLQARNFYYGLALLPEPKRSALFALYAYMRCADDLADDEDGRTPEQRLDDLEKFQRATHRAFDGNIPQEEPAEFWPAFADMVRSYEVPAYIFDDAIAGQRQDVRGTTFEKFDEVREYCYRVAGTVGLGSLFVWGFDGGKKAESMAIDRGIALQLTNILRDLSEDAGRGRVYLSNDDLTRFGLTRADILARRPSEGFEALMRFEIERAENFFEQSQPLEQLISADCRATLNTMSNIYHRLLGKIAADPMRVLRQRISLSMARKIMIAVGATWGKTVSREKGNTDESRLDVKRTI